MAPHLCPLMSFNVHGLLHVVDDVKTLGPLESYSALAYENNMRILKKYCRKPHLTLQQIARRRAEQSNCSERNDNRKSNRNHQSGKLLTLRRKHNAGPIPIELSGAQQYSELQGFKVGLQLHNHCCIMQDKSICIIVNILEFGTTYYLVVKKFRRIDHFYNVGIPSTSVGVYKCSLLSTYIHCISVSDIKAKCYKMSYWPSHDTEDFSSSERTSYTT